jgi:hypothetical protein
MRSKHKASGFEITPLPTTRREASVAWNMSIYIFHMNTIAFWVWIAVMAWLLFTIAVFAFYQRETLRSVMCSIECIADI